MQFVARSKGNCPGTPPEIAQKVNEYVEWKDRFDANPAAVLNSMVQAQAQEIARQTFQQQFAEQQRQSEINRIVAENQSWMCLSKAFVVDPGPVFQTPAEFRLSSELELVTTPHGERGNGGGIPSARLTAGRGDHPKRRQPVLAFENFGGCRAALALALRMAGALPIPCYVRCLRGQ